VRVERVDLCLARPRAEVVGPTLYLTYETTEPDRPALLVKAILDRALALVLLVLTLPLGALIALLVKLTSPGPVLFTQQRAGLNGRPFRMVKFRTMRAGAEAERTRLLHVNELTGPIFKMRDDPRVTPTGHFLRKTSLDELPQLLNVALGHMSLVGPRPLPLIENWELLPVHRRRLSVKPGITGLWQVSGRNDLTFEEWMALDLQYVDNWSLGLDLAIMLRTPPAVLSRRGAR
jgi:lipopolysaccharide/colanic/teichoic acid biosynthesis glycosyltransferase